MAAEVRRLTAAAGMSGRELAELSGIARATLAVKLAGGRPFDVGELNDVAAALGTDAAVIIAVAIDASSRARPR